MGQCNSHDPRLDLLKQDLGNIKDKRKEILKGVLTLERDLVELRRQLDTAEKSLENSGVDAFKDIKIKRDKTLLSVKGVGIIAQDLHGLQEVHKNVLSSIAELHAMPKLKIKKVHYDPVVSDPHGLLEEDTTSPNQEVYFSEQSPSKDDNVLCDVPFMNPPQSPKGENNWLLQLIEPIIGVFAPTDQPDLEDDEYRTGPEYEKRKRKHERMLKRKFRKAAKEASQAAKYELENVSRVSRVHNKAPSVESIDSDKDDDDDGKKSISRTTDTSAPAPSKPSLSQNPLPPPSARKGIRLQALEITVPVRGQGMGLKLQEVHDPQFGHPGYVLMRVEGFSDALVNVGKIAGVKPGDVIVQVNGRTAKNADSFVEYVKSAQDILILTVLREHHMLSTSAAPASPDSLPAQS